MKETHQGFLSRSIPARRRRSAQQTAFAPIKKTRFSVSFLLVREMRLELTRRLPHAPQTCLSTYSSTLAYCAFPQCQIIIIANASFVNHIFSELSSLRASYGARKAVDMLFPSLYNGGMQILRGCRMAAPILSGAVCRAGRALRRLPRRTSITMLPPVVLVPVCRLRLEVFL